MRRASCRDSCLPEMRQGEPQLEGERKQVTVLFADVKGGHATAASASDYPRVSRHD
jgi:uncharacterized protein (DUF433 family)